MLVRIFTYLYDHIACYVLAMPLRVSRSEFRREMRTWITIALLVHVLLLLNPLLYLVYSCSLIMLYYVSIRTLEGMSIRSRTVNDVKCLMAKLDDDVRGTISIFTAEWAGRRSYMEDRILTDSRNNIFGIFDGHGGSSVSDYLVRHFAKEYTALKKRSADSTASLKRAMLNLEDQIRMKQINGGSTGLVVKIDHDRITCCSTGDSEAHVMDRYGSIRSLSSPHTFTRFDEYVRYANINTPRHGTVLRTRTGLMPTRTIGDIKHKVQDPGLIATPELKRYDGNWELVVLGSDGIFDCMSPRMIVDELIHSEILRNGEYSFDKKCIDRFVTRVQKITTRIPTFHQKMLNVYGGDNCSIILIINQNVESDDWDVVDAADAVNTDDMSAADDEGNCATSDISEIMHLLQKLSHAHTSESE